MSQSPQTGQVYFNVNQELYDMTQRDPVTIPSNGSSLFQYKEKWKIAEFLTSMVTIPSNGSSLFQSTDTTETTVFFWLGVTIPSNGSSLFQ